MGKSVKKTEKNATELIEKEQKAVATSSENAEQSANKQEEVKPKKSKKDIKEAIIKIEAQEREIVKNALEDRLNLVKEHLDKAKEMVKDAKEQYKKIKKASKNENSAEVVIAAFNLHEAKIHKKEHKRLLKRIKQSIDAVS